MSEKTTAEVAAEYAAACKTIDPFKKAVQDKVDAAASTAREFFKAKDWRPQEEASIFAYFYGNRATAYVRNGNIVEDGLYFQFDDYNGVEEDFFIPFNAIDNPLPTLEAEWAVYITEKEARDAHWKKARREELEAKLKELDD